jgi:hypothetical protein
MDDNLKFKVNQRTGQDYLAETFELDYSGMNTFLTLLKKRKNSLILQEAGRNISNDFVVGFNTGCSTLS